jgi:16S rRNA (guanine1207-N2)-methyltransferase
VTSHYFSAEPSGPERRQTITATVWGRELRLLTAKGVFAGDALDEGTAVLLRESPIPTGRPRILDLGCGYGPIAITVAHWRKRARVWAVDVNERALELARRNAESAGRGNIRVCRPEEVPEDVRFAAIYSNPPIKVGKSILHEMLVHWTARLLPGGSAYLVVQKHLGSDSLARWLNEQGFPTTRLTSERGYRVLRVQPPTGDH